MPALGMAKAAEGYGQRGYPVFPLHTPEGGGCSCRRPDCEAVGKHPRIVQWPDNATTSEGTIRSWWRRWPEANIGLVTGETSGLVVLDVDPRHGGDAALEALQREFGELPPTLRAQTGGGGLHLFFRHPGVRVPNSAGAMGSGLDIRGDGGYIVAPPSRHASGGRYAWDPARHPRHLEPAPMPQWLLDRAVRPDRGVLTPFRRSSLCDLVLTGVAAGQRNTSLVRLAGHLFRHRVDPYVCLGLLKSWNEANCRPPLTESELMRTIESIAGAELRRRGLR
ncbi:MAG: bifunctional DNA primase/polymerase [Acidobacteriota bacterium]